jgi:hypothetical protein
VVRTIVASFDDYRSAQRVACELMDDGFMARDISIVASSLSHGDEEHGEGAASFVADHAAATGALTGGVVGGAAGLAARLMALSVPGIGPVRVDETRAERATGIMRENGAIRRDSTIRR